MLYILDFLAYNGGQLVFSICVLVAIVAITQIIKAAITARGNRGYHDLSQRMLETNMELKAELVKMGEKINSMEKMLKDVQ